MSKTLNQVTVSTYTDPNGRPRIQVLRNGMPCLQWRAEDASRTRVKAAVRNLWRQTDSPAIMRRWDGDAKLLHVFKRK